MTDKDEDDHYDRLWKETQLRLAKAAGFESVEAQETDVKAKREEAAQQHRERVAAVVAQQQAVALAQANAAGFPTFAAYEEARQQQQAKAERDRKVYSCVMGAQLPARQFEARAATLTGEQQLVMDAIMPILTTGGIVAMIGPRGTGKTHLAVKLVIEHAKATLATARYAKTLDYFRELKDTFSKESSNSERDVVRTFTNYGLLVLDEVQERGGSEWELTQLTDLIDRRYSSRRPIVLISNEKREALATSLGASICSRLREDGDVFELAGESARETIRAERLGVAK